MLRTCRILSTCLSGFKPDELKDDFHTEMEGIFNA